MKILPFLKKSKLQQILIQYNKFINSGAYKKLKEAENDIHKLFFDESQECKYFELTDKDENGFFIKTCTNKKGYGICEINSCPFR